MCSLTTEGATVVDHNDDGDAGLSHFLFFKFNSIIEIVQHDIKRVACLLLIIIKASKRCPLGNKFLFFPCFVFFASSSSSSSSCLRFGEESTELLLTNFACCQRHNLTSRKLLNLLHSQCIYKMRESD